MLTPIVQFGTSRFLQAHVDLFVSDARSEGQDVGPITVVQTSGIAERAGRLKGFDGSPIPIIVRGVEDRQPVERTEHVRSIVRGLSTATDWSQIEQIVVEEARVLVSNVGDGGYRVPDGEIVGETLPRSFPAKLTKLLLARWRGSGMPVTMFPCELVSSNGAMLRALCSSIAMRSNLPAAFQRWLVDECVWVNSLVDRIVSSSLDPVGAIAEPYALWAIERRPGVAPPCTHPAIRLVDDLRTSERLKLFILNLGHTVLAERWLAEKRRPEETVYEMLGESAIRNDLDTLYDDEVLPIFAAADISEAPAYRASVIERFANPFLDHLLADIADNHATKKERRLGGILKLAGDVAPSLRLQRLRTMESSAVG
jgi:tagaturonate reductase